MSCYRFVVFFTLVLPLIGVVKRYVNHLLRLLHDPYPSSRFSFVCIGIHLITSMGMLGLCIKCPPNALIETTCIRSMGKLIMFALFIVVKHPNKKNGIFYNISNTGKRMDNG